MALDSHAQAVIALNRFGFTPKTGVPSDPRAALLADLTNPAAGRIANKELPTVGEAARAVFAFRQERKAERLEKPTTTRSDIGGNVNKPDMARSNGKADVAKLYIRSFDLKGRNYRLRVRWRHNPGLVFEELEKRVHIQRVLVGIGDATQ